MFILIIMVSITDIITMINLRFIGLFEKKGWFEANDWTQALK